MLFFGMARTTLGFQQDSKGYRGKATEEKGRGKGNLADEPYAHGNLWHVHLVSQEDPE